jgi:succinyl-CoA synthetase beta subunit
MMQIYNLYKLFIKVDATQIEINPFAQINDNRGFNFKKIFK